MARFKVIIPSSTHGILQRKAARKKLTANEYITSIIIGNIKRNKGISKIYRLPNCGMVQGCVRPSDEDSKLLENFFNNTVISRNAVITSWLMEAAR